MTCYFVSFFSSIDVRFNFDKRKTSEIDSLGTSYDYLSIMHYNRKAFGGGSLTIVAKDPTFQKQIGQREGLSDIDIIQINKMYCSEYILVRFSRGENYLEQFIEPDQRLNGFFEK